MHDQDDQDDEQEYELVSKSEMKREMERWQALGAKLTELSPAQWLEMPITERLMSALEESKRISQHGARKRHLQYIGRVMRDEDIDAIQQAVDLLDPASEAYGKRQKQLELWRRKLIDDPSALQSFLDQYPSVERQQLGNLIRNARKEQKQKDAESGPAFKKLFQFLKTTAG